MKETNDSPRKLLVTLPKIPKQRRVWQAERRYPNISEVCPKIAADSPLGMEWGQMTMSFCLPICNKQTLRLRHGISLSLASFFHFPHSGCLLFLFLLFGSSFWLFVCLIPSHSPEYPTVNAAHSERCTLPLALKQPPSPPHNLTSICYSEISRFQVPILRST